MDRHTKVILLSIILLGFGLRALWLHHSPPALNWDEVALGYNSYSLSKTGRDEFGYKLPILLRSFDDYKSSAYAYFSIPFIYFLGLNEISVRLLSSLSGTMIIVVTYFLAKNLTNNRIVGMFASLAISISPWAIFFSRAAFEANLALLFYLAGVYCLIINSKSPGKHLVSAVFLLSLSIYSYHSEKILAPITFILFMFTNHFLIRKNQKTILLFLLTLLPLAIIYFNNPETTSRMSSTSLYHALKRNSDLSPSSLVNAIYSRYLSYFSPINLFVRGTGEPTQQISGFAEFYSFWFFFWVAGIINIIKNPKKYKNLALLTIISPLPAILTWNWFYPARVLPLFVFFTIIISIGFVSIARHKLALLFIVPLTIMSLTHLIGSITYIFPGTSKGAWQFGMKEIITESSKVEGDYNRIIFETRTAQPHIFILFYSNYSPDKYQKEIKKIADNPKGRKDFNFGKYEFRDVYWFRQDEYAKDTLLVGPPSSLPLEEVRLNKEVDRIIVVKDKEGNVLAHIVGMK